MGTPTVDRARDLKERAIRSVVSRPGSDSKCSASISIVLVQREMENWRSPLASIPPSFQRPSWQNPAPSRLRTVEQAAVETATGCKRRSGWLVPFTTGRA